MMFKSDKIMALLYVQNFFLILSKQNLYAIVLPDLNVFWYWVGFESKFSDPRIWI